MLKAPTTVLLTLALTLLVPGWAPGGVGFFGQEPEQDPIAFFEQKLQPLMEENCFSCHGGGRRIRAGLNLTTRAGVMKGAGMGPAVDLEHPDQSPLLQMLSYKDEDHQMPPFGKLEDEEIAIFEQWIRLGAPWTPSDGDEAEAIEEPEPKLGRHDGLAGWSYRPVQEGPPPQVQNTGWVRNPIDAFVLKRLEAAGLQPAPLADKLALIRRAYYDLTGLPPAPEAIDAFLADEAPDAYERLLERLLASPQYGEKWGRHWLDLVRYAETNGYERDTDKPFIWRYRDYVIESFNADKPYDRFLMEQLAGDELEEVTPETMIATGYYRLMQWDDEPGQGTLQARYDILDDVVSTTSQVFMGMTLGCARCHDHKGDPLPQKDYYRFMSLFHGLTDMSVDGFLREVMSPAERAEYEKAHEAKASRESRLMARVHRIENEFVAALSKADPELAAQFAVSDLQDLAYRFYRDTWDRLPDFDNLRPETSGEVVGNWIHLGMASRKDAIGLVFEGELLVPKTGDYHFFLDSDDGSRLSLDGKTLIEYDGIHGLGKVQHAEVRLRKGTVPLRVDYFNQGGPLGLKLWWSRTRPEVWRYTTDDPGEKWNRFHFEDDEWLAGRGGFGTPGTLGSEVRTLWNTSDIWLRRAMKWNPNERKQLRFAVHHDDDIEIYINGVLACEAKGYKVETLVLEPSEEARKALRAGKNVLAVHCRNTGGGQSVQVRPVHVDEIDSRDPMDLSFARRPLHGTPELAGEELEHWLKERGEEVLGTERFAEYREWQRELDASRKHEIPRRMAAVVQERGPEAEDMFVHVRGNAHVKGDPVEPGFPAVLGSPELRIPPRPEGTRTTGRRRALAEWLVDPEHPLTSRVMVNRLWQFHFGRGLVRSSSDFGEFGERPTHPKLLDWLAREFLARGWSMKAMHRLIMQSNTYRMSAQPNDQALLKDPANDLFWRFDRRRLTAEEMRDSLLAMTGRLNLEMGGPGFYSMMPAEVLATSSRPNEVWGKSPEDQLNRRSVYIKVKRSLQTPILASFDVADTDQSCAVRFQTTQPTQALGMLNGEFAHKQAAAFAERLRNEAGDEPRSQVQRGLRLATGREPDRDEVRSYLRLMRELQRDYRLDAQTALQRFCLIAFNLNEFAYLD